MSVREYEGFEFGIPLPDARLRAEGKRKRTEVPGPFGEWYERVYCVNCGQSGGAVTKAWAPFVFYLCDECAQRWGRIPLPEIPEELVR